MEEDECDFRTPIGQVIKHINTVCKKPQIDEQLNEALDLFNERLNQQEKYLLSGIFKINFAEAALFIQSSADLYGKKIDLLWDELLEFHTRLITYEYEHQKEKGKGAVSQEAIAKLEERRNRSKRRKKFKFVFDTTERQKFSKFIFDDDRLPPETENLEDYSELTRMWREFEWEAEKVREVPLIVPRHMLQYYRLTNYHVLEAEDYEIIDPEDGEYNTLYSRVPSYHHVEHLFDYNDNGMLPDTNNIISKLRLTAYGRINFLRRRNIPFDTPFEEYKDEYVAYRNEFFKEESKKWQNMPLDTLEDLHKQIQYLVQKEREENGETAGSDKTDKRISDKIEILDNSDDDSLFELSFTCDKDFMKSALFVRLEKLSTDIIDTKLRQDSGFFDFVSDSEKDDDGTAGTNLDSEIANDNPMDGDTNNMSVDDTVVNSETNVTVNDTAAANLNSEITNGNGMDVVTNMSVDDTVANSETNVTVSDMAATNPNSEIANDNPMDVDTNNMSVDDSVVNGVTVNIFVNDTAATNLMTEIRNDNRMDVDRNNIHVDDTVINTETNVTVIETNNNVNIMQTSGDNYCCTTTNAIGDSTNIVDNFETRSFISDHDYCLNVSNVGPRTHCVERTSNAVNKNIIENENSRVAKDPVAVQKNVGNRTVIVEAVNKPLCGTPRIVAKIIAIKEKNEKRTLNNESENIEPPSKRRKLSQKQIANLLKSKIKPVKHLKFEKFFSLNYQPELGEGEIQEVDYTSEESDIENDDPEPLQNLPNESQSVHADNDDTCTFYSDHDYCQSAKDLHNDSGFLESSPSQQVVEDISDLHTQGGPNENALADSNARKDIPSSMEDEYQRLLDSMREPGVDLMPERESDGCLTEEQKQKLESQARVQEWRNTINPILKNLKEHDFDIHEYGSRIIDDMEVSQTKSFSNIVQGKTSAEVVRFFISSLQLANTNNIEICGAKAGELSNDTFEVKLISKDRYHEHLQEFLAPSVETLQEKLDKVRAMKDTEAKSVAPQTNVSTQMDVSSKRKRIEHTFIPNKQRTVMITPSTSTNNKTTYKRIVKKPEALYKVKESRVVIKSVAQENCNAKSNKGKLQNVYKGKSIIKKQPLADRSQKPLTLNTDITLPSTSYHVLWSGSSNYGDSDREYSPVYSPRSPSLEGSQSSTISARIPSTSYSSAPPHKRRRESSEESFRERLIAAQEINPYIQLQSTPRGPSRKQLFLMVN